MRHPVSSCQERLRSLPSYDPFLCRPSQFICACGRRWVHVCDEAEGCFYAVADPDCEMTRQDCRWPQCKCNGGVGWFELQRYARANQQVHLPALLSDLFGISTSEARRNLAGGGVHLDDLPVTELDATYPALCGRTLRLGKRRSVLLDADVLRRELRVRRRS